MTDGRHIHPRPRGDLVLCDGRCGASLPVTHEVDAAVANELATARGWAVTHSMLRSFHWCPACTVFVAADAFSVNVDDPPKWLTEPANDFLRRETR